MNIVRGRMAIITMIVTRIQPIIIVLIIIIKTDKEILHSSLMDQ